MSMHIDISGQVTQTDKPSSLAFVKDDGSRNVVYVDAETKRRILKRHSGKVENLPEKLHCIMIYFCIKDYLKDVDELVICRDINPRRINKILLSLFKEHGGFPKIIIRGHDQPDSDAHFAALSGYRKKSSADLIITDKMINKMLKI